MLVPLTAIVTTSLPMAAAIALCAKDRKSVHGKNKNKSNKSAKSSKSIRGKSSKSGKSSRSHRSKSQRSKRSSKKGKSSKSGKGKKSGKSSKSKKSAKKTASSSGSVSRASSVSGAASEKSTKSSRSSRKGSKSSKSRKARRLDSDAQNKMQKSQKSTKTAISKPQETTAGSQAAKSLVEEVNAIKHSNQLSVVPSKLQYQTLGGVNQIELKNTSGQRKAYKVKCSDNALYRVNPVFGFAEPHSSVKIDVLRLNGEQKTDKLVLVTANAKDASDPHEAFAKQAEQREMMVVPLVAA